MESHEENNTKESLPPSDNQTEPSTGNESGSVNYGSEIEGTDVEDSDALYGEFNFRMPQLVRPVYTCSDDEEEYDKVLEQMLQDSDSEDETSSGSEEYEDRLSKHIYREPYSDSEDENSEPESNNPRDDTGVSFSASGTQENNKFEWKPLKNTLNDSKKPDLKRKQNVNKNVAPDTVEEPTENKKIDMGEMSTDNSQDRREKFCDDNIGATKTYANAYEAFTAIWDQETVELIITETNRYARQSKIDHWQDTTMDEMYVYLGIIISSTVGPIDDIKEHWFGDGLYARPSFPYLMSYERFRQLTDCIHFCDNTNINDKRDVINNSQAKLCKLKPLLELLNKKFSSLYIMGQNIILDEGMTQWKGWIDRRIYIEPDPVEIKSIEISEPNTGYLWKVKLVPGDVTTKMIPGLVVELLKGLEHKGYTVWLDKFYSSPILARQLKKLGFDCAGSLKKSFLPTEVLERVNRITSSDKKKDNYMSEIYGGTSGDVDVFAWITKNRCTCCITTYHGAETVQNVNLKTPKVLLDYDKMMYGVHKKDNLLFHFPTERTHAHVWYKMFFRKLLNASVLNSHILYNKKNLKHHNFRMELCSQIFIIHSCKSPSSNFLSENSHTLVQYGNQANNNMQIKNKCYSCGILTEWYCNCCILPFCSNACFGESHNDDDSQNDSQDDSQSDSQNDSHNYSQDDSDDMNSDDSCCNEL